MLKLIGFEMGEKRAKFYVEADTDAHLAELLKRLVAGTLLDPLGPVAVTAPVAMGPPPSAPAAPAKAPAAPKAAPPAAEPPPAAKPAPKPKAAPPPPVVDEDEDGLPTSKPAEDDEDGAIIPVAIMNAKKLREVITELQATGVTTKAEIKAWCLRNQTAVPVLATIADLEERVDRATNLLSIS